MVFVFFLVAKMSEVAGFVISPMFHMVSSKASLKFIAYRGATGRAFFKNDRVVEIIDIVNEIDGRTSGP